MCERTMFGQTQFCGKIQRLNCFSEGVWKVQSKHCILGLTYHPEHNCT